MSFHYFQRHVGIPIFREMRADPQWEKGQYNGASHDAQLKNHIFKFLRQKFTIFLFSRRKKTFFLPRLVAVLFNDVRLVGFIHRCVSLLFWR